MKRIMTAGLIALLSAAASSAWAGPLTTKASRYEADLRALASHVHQLGACVAIGFDVDPEVVQQGIDEAMDRLRASGYSGAAIQDILQQSVAASEANVVRFTFEPFSKNTPAVFNRMEARFAALQTACDQLYTQPTLAAFITKDAYQSSSGKKSFFGLTAFQAEHGETKKMVLLGNFYDGGVRPDPGHKLAFSWYVKAAEAGDPTGAYFVASAYALGDGVARNSIQAEKWAVISDSLGGPPGTLEIIEPGLTPAQQKQGRDLAVAWLEMHE